MKHTDLACLTFAQVPAAGETAGLGRQLGILYRRHTYTALDTDGLPREYRVTVSSRGVVKVAPGWLTAEGKAQRLARMQAAVPLHAAAFVADFFPTAPCNPHNAVMLARYLGGMDKTFQGLLNWQQGADLRTHGWTGQTNGEALDFIATQFAARVPQALAA